jgi:hypothetical protein
MKTFNDDPPRCEVKCDRCGAAQVMRLPDQNSPDAPPYWNRLKVRTRAATPQVAAFIDLCPACSDVAALAALEPPA